MVDENHIPRCILVTGGAGFIGANYVRLAISEGSARIINLDALTYAGSLANLEGVIEGDRYRFVHGSITDETLLARLFADEPIDTVIHFAAESHVDRSIDGPGAFLETNITGTYALLQATRAAWGQRDDVRFHHVSTDEVYGSLGDEGLFTEDTPYDPSSPYSASKAASDHLVRAWHRTFGLPVTISNCSNNYGPFQFPEKLIPLIIMRALAKEALPVYGTGENIRDWLYVEDHCRAIDRVIRAGRNGRTYNIGGHNERTNISIVEEICSILDGICPSGIDGGYRSLITFVKDRPGHDMRYAIDAGRMRDELAWTPSETFSTGIAKTIAWYLESQDWIQQVKSERYAGERLGTGKV